MHDAQKTTGQKVIKDKKSRNKREQMFNYRKLNTKINK